MCTKCKSSTTFDQRMKVSESVTTCMNTLQWNLSMMYTIKEYSWGFYRGMAISQGDISKHFKKENDTTRKSHVKHHFYGSRLYFEILKIVG